VAESYGGSVALEHSGAGTGARFVVRLPAETAPENPLDAAMNSVPRRASRPSA